MKLNFVDMDGVIAKTSLGLQIHLGLDEVTPTNYNWCNGLVNWSTLGIEFWKNLPVYQDTLYLLQQLNNVKIITHCFSLNAMIGKQLWLDKYWPGIEMINLEDKWLLAGTGRVLWDDYPKQIDNWIKAGGVGNLIERSWNKDLEVEK